MLTYERQQTQEVQLVLDFSQAKDLAKRAAMLGAELAETQHQAGLIATEIDQHESAAGLDDMAETVKTARTAALDGSDDYQSARTAFKTARKLARREGRDLYRAAKAKKAHADALQAELDKARRELVAGLAGAGK